jgi:molybdopterin/thiamine biosynthesis adenylyltransferase
MTNILYQRQEPLDLKIPYSVLVIGAGGIGSWVALNLALIGTKHIVIVDNDTIEIHNLNRTPYTLLHVDLNKVDALEDLIMERRENVIVKTYNNTLRNVLSILKNKTFDYIIDCRDRVTEQYIEELKQLNANYGKVKLGYDGKSITFHFNPTSVPWGETTNGYRIVPSYLVPPQLLANLLTELITSGNFPKENDKIITITVTDLLKKIGLVS